MERPIRRTTPYAMLGMLTLGPMSGYEMKRQMEQSIAHFWSESYGQIYPALKQLETEGLATSRPQRSTTGRPDRQIYAITPKGREMLGVWLRESPKLQPPRSELLLKLFFWSQLPPDEATKHVEALRNASARELEQYAGIEANLKTNHAGHPALPYWLMTLSFGRHRSQGMHAWAIETLNELKRLKGKK
jgi:PadR family transcriptional regulator, regulatory protein AphA